MENNNKIYLIFYQTVRKFKRRYCSEIRCVISDFKNGNDWMINGIKQKRRHLIYKYKLLYYDKDLITRKIYDIISKHLIVLRYHLKNKNLTEKMMKLVNEKAKRISSRIMSNYHTGDFLIGCYFYQSKKLTIY